MFDQVLSDTSLYSHLISHENTGEALTSAEYTGSSGWEVTYGNEPAAGGGFHRVTTAEDVAAEVSPHTYL